MRKEHTGGLNELMIVNPSPAASSELLLGEDGTVYQLQGTGEVFLGEDGALYELPGPPGLAEVSGLSCCQESEPRRVFLGADGALYEVTDE